MIEGQRFSRRTFMGTTAATAAGLAVSASALGWMQPKPKPLNILILGGTGFLGPHVVRTAIDRGHTMTLFNRGRTNTHLFPELEKLKGDRDGDLESLKGRSWDAVIDTSAYYPRAVNLSAGLLKDVVDQYLLISTISVYRALNTPDMDETAPVGTIDDPTVEEVTGLTYGPLKALCEQAAEAQMPGRTTNIRPGLIVGPGDPTDRFTYWPSRVSRGGEVLAPGEPGHYTQHIDVRDLAAFMIHCLEQRTTGVFNADRPARSVTMGSLLETCKHVSGSDAMFTWADADFLGSHQVAPWSNMPCWVPPGPGYLGFGQVSSQKAIDAGLVNRPLDETVRGTLDWVKTLPQDRRDQLVAARRAGLPPERERAVLAAWHSRNAEDAG